MARLWLRVLMALLFGGSVGALLIFIETGMPLAIIDAIWALALAVWAGWLAERYRKKS